MAAYGGVQHVRVDVVTHAPCPTKCWSLQQSCECVTGRALGVCCCESIVLRARVGTWTQRSRCLDAKESYAKTKTAAARSYLSPCDCRLAHKDGLWGCDHLKCEAN